MGVSGVFTNVLDAIRQGNWSFEPPEIDPDRFEPTSAIPGTREKLAILAERARTGLPLWHQADRIDYDEPAR
jgi:hypothetical protein